MEFEMNLEQTLNEITGKLYGKNIGACTDAQLYTGVLQLTKEKMADHYIIPEHLQGCLFIQSLYFQFFFCLLCHNFFLHSIQKPHIYNMRLLSVIHSLLFKS